MNKTYKVIYNRTRCMYQVVSELAKGHTKSETPEMLKSLFSKHSGLTRGIVMAVLSMSLAMPVGVAVQAADTAGTGETTTSTSDTTTSNTSDTTTTDTTVTVKDGAALVGSGAVSVSSTTSDDKNIITISVPTNGTVEANNTGLVTGGTVYTAITDANTALSNKIGTLNANGNYIQKDASVSSNLFTLDSQMKTNAEAIDINKTSIAANASAITSLKDLSNITDAGKTVIKEQAKQAVKVAAGNRVTVTTTGSETGDGTITYTVSANNDGTISIGDTNLVSGGTMYTELRPASTGTYYYISNTNTTAANLIALDAALNKAIAAMDIDMSDSTTYTSKLSKYFKVNPKVTTSTDGKTKTYAPDAAANGTNSVAIGPNAQAGEKTTDATTSTTTVTGGTSSTAIGDSAVANGNTSVALGADAQVLNTTDQDGKTTATITGSTAIGSGAKVNGATDATAIGTSAQVNETAAGGIAFGKNAVTGEDKGTVTVGDVTANVAAVGGENSVALGTSAKASGNTALALGKGAQVNNYTTQSGTTVTKTVNSGSTAIGSEAKVTGANDAVAFGSGATVTGTGTNADDSMAIGKKASVATAKDAVALGTSAAVASGADNAIAVGNTAKANTSNTTAIGYNASATGAGAVAIGENTSTSTEGGISIGSGTSVSGKSIVIGYATDANGNTVKTESQNTDAVAIGNGAQANANDSISIGHQAGKDTSEGRTSGYGSLIAIGTNAGNNVKGMQNVALGSGAGSNVKSSYNVAIGSNAGAGINYAASADTNPQNGYNISIGYEANYQSADANAKNIAESIAIGHSANAVSNATAMGYKTTASGDKSMALGYSATAADTDSIALGDNASAAGGNIAIGSGSQAPAVASYDKGYLTGSTSVNGYISIGGTTSATGTTVLRRISNVADGAADQDAVTVAQLKAAYTNLEGTIKTTDTKISDTYTQSAIDSKIATVESKITASQTKYFFINPSSDTLTANANNDGASTSGAADAMAIGPNATATSAKAVAIGNNVSASGKGSIALGTADNPATTGTVDAGNNTSANPHVTSAEGANSVAIGTSAIAQTDNSVALGTRASVYTSNVTDTTTGTTTKVGQQSIAIGYEAETRNSNATSIGSGAKAYSDGSTAIGHSAYAQGADSVVLGTSSTANGASSGIVGKSNTINGSNTYAVGSENNVNGNWGAVTYSGLYGSKNIVNPVSDTSGNTKHGMDSLSITGNSNTISQGSYSDTVQNISILGNSNSVTGANTDEANAGTTANITVIGGSNTVTGRDGAGSDDMGKTWNQLTRTTVIGYSNIVNQAASTTSLADTQILGNDVTATLGNSVYLGTGSAAKNANLADATTLTDAEQAAVDALDTTGMTDTEKATAQANAKAAARYATNLKTMKQSGTTAGLQSLSTDTTYDDGTSYTYAGSSPAGVVTVGSVGSERRLQNVAAGLVSASSTDAVNGSQLYALTRQIRFGGDNSSFGDTAAGDTNVVARGSNEKISITGGSDAVTSSTTDGTTTYTVDAAKLTDNNIAVVANTDTNALHVQLASNLKDLNTAQLGSGSGESYKETIKLDGTGTTGGQMTLAGADGTVKTTLDTTGLTIANGPKFTSSGIDAANQQIKNVTAGTDDTDAANVGQVKSARTLLTQGTNTTLGDVEANGHHTYTVNVDNLAVKANGTGTTVALANGINFKNGTNTTATVGTDGTVTINAIHNKLDSASYTASTPSDTSNQTTVKLKDTDGNETTLNLTDTYTTVSKNTDHTISFKRNDGSDPVSVSLDDLNGASKEALTTAAAKATTTVIKGNNVDSVDDDTTSADGHHIYKVNVSNLGVKVADGQKKSVALSEGLVFGNGTNTTASVGDNGAITFNVSNEAIKTQAKDAIDVVKGNDNVTVDTTTSTDGTKKTFTISAKDTYTTVTKDADRKTVTFARNDGQSQTVSLSDLGGITATQDKYVTSGTVTYDANGNGTASLTGNNGLTASITGLKDTKVSSGAATYVGKQGDASGSATLTMNDGSTATISGLKDDYITSASVGTETNHVTMTRLGGGTVDLNLNPILEKYSLSDYHLVGAGTTHDQAYAVDSNGTVTLNIVDDKNPTGTPKTIQITGLASQSGVNAGRTTVKSSDNSVMVSDSTANSDTHTYDIKVDYSKIPANLTVQYSGDNGTTGSNTMNTATAFSGTANQIVTKAENGKVTFKLADDISGINSVTTGDAKLDTNGLTIKEGTAAKVAITSGNVTMGGNVIHNVGDGVAATDAVNKRQLDALQTQVSGGWNLAGNNAEGNAVTAKIGAGKTVTYGDGNYTKSVVTKDDTTGNATVKVDVTAGTFGSGTGDKAGTVTSTANGLATTQDVANAINSASISVVADNTPENKTAVKAGDTIHFAKDDNLTLTQDGTTFTYGLNPEISISKVTTSDTTKGSTVQTAEGITTKDAAGNTYEQTANGITLTPKTPGTGKTAVSLTNTGLNNGNNVISGVGAGSADTDAVNVSQLKKVQDQVGSGWQIAGNDGTKVADIGAGKKVAFKSNSKYLTTSTARSATGDSDTGADVTYSLKTAVLASGTDGTVTAVADANDGLVTAKNVAETINQTYWTAASGKSGSGSQTDETANAADKQISAGDTVTFNAGDNLSLVQNGASFTYGLQTDLTGMNTIRFGGTLNNGSWSGGLLIGNQAGSGANTAEGNYITGLSNTKWDRATISENSSMAATEGQLKQAIENITKSGDGTGGFGLTADSGEAIMQDLRKTIQIKGDGEGKADGNITTSNESGVLRIRLNKKLDLTDQGSVTIGSSKVSDGSIVLGNTDATKKIALNSNEGTASIGGVTVNGTAKTVSGLSNTEWNVETAAANGYTGSNQAATESQLQTVYNQATKTASENELHTLAKEGGYTVDDNHQVSMDVVNGKGVKQGSIVINDVAKASEVGTVSEIADDLKKKNGDTVQPTSVVEAINNLNDKVGDKKYSTVQGKEIADGDSATTAIGKLNNRMNDIYTTAGQHSSVSKADDNLTISESKNASGGTDYKIGLNKEQIDLGNVIIKGNEGSISAKSMTSDSFTAGDTVVNKDGIKVGDKSALTSDSLKVNGKTYISSDGINANSQKITNVQTGTADTDAANVGQMREADAQLADAIQQTDAGLNEVGRAVNKLGNRLNRVGAGAAALAALHPGTYDPNDKWDFSAGIGHYHDANAVAIGAYYHPNDTTILSIGGSMGGGENMVNAGITWKMGRSGREQAAQPVVVRKAEAAPVVQQAAPVRTAPVVTLAPVTTPAPVKSVASVTPVHAVPAVTTPMTQTTTGDTAALAQILARQTAILEKLAQNQAQAAPSAAVAHGDDIFPDVPDNHWAYAYVAKLEKAGALKGFKRPAVLKSPMMTRDDFASVLYTAMANGATTNPALNGDDSLNRLAQEFKAELKNVKV